MCSGGRLGSFEFGCLVVAGEETGMKGLEKTEEVGH